MKMLAVLMLSCSCLYGADPTTNASDITTKSFNSQRDGGKTQIYGETIYRNKKPILRILHTVRSGITNTSRSYEVSGDLLVVETDKDGDGFFEDISIFHPVTKEIEMFTRQTNGSINPVSTETLLATKKQITAIGDAVQKLFSKDGLTDSEFEELVPSVQKKIHDAEKKKKDGTK
jgi:hypothetical protein